jgi:hypothetical protein
MKLLKALFLAALLAVVPGIAHATSACVTGAPWQTACPNSSTNYICYQSYNTPLTETYWSTASEPICVPSGQPSRICVPWCAGFQPAPTTCGIQPKYATGYRDSAWNWHPFASPSASSQWLLPGPFNQTTCTYSNTRLEVNGVGSFLGGTLTIPQGLTDTLNNATFYPFGGGSEVVTVIFETF